MRERRDQPPREPPSGCWRALAGTPAPLHKMQAKEETGTRNWELLIQPPIPPSALKLNAQGKAIDSIVTTLKGMQASYSQAASIALDSR